MLLYKLKKHAEIIKNEYKQKQIQSRDIIRSTFVAVFGYDEI